MPLLVPEINADHLKHPAAQQRKRGWKGQIVTNPNCSTIVLTMALAPLKQFGITKVIVTTLQAISGAGYPACLRWTSSPTWSRSSGNEEERWKARRRRSWATSPAMRFTTTRAKSAPTAIASLSWTATP